MKKILLFSFLLISVWIRSQIVFCPKGAEWSYNFNIAFSEEILNEKITYVRDSIMVGDTVKVLKVNFFYKVCNTFETGLVLIRQINNTVYFRCTQTKHNWEILYNFDAKPGEIWQTKVLLGNNTLNTYTVQVNSDTTIFEKGFELKRMKVTYMWVDLPYDPTFTVKQDLLITERFGCSDFLFNYMNGMEGACDADYFTRFLCYKDKELGTKFFTDFPCDYKLIVDIKELYSGEQVQIYPNPAKQILYLSFNEELARKFEITDISGRRVLDKESSAKNPDLDINELQNGIYFLRIRSGAQQSVYKIIVEK